MDDLGPFGVAIRCDPQIKSFYTHLRDQGKPPKVAIVAAMRKMLIFANVILQHDRPWINNPSRPPIRLLSEVEGGVQFTNHAHHKYAFHHIFGRVCDENGIEHRLKKVKHPWTNGQSLPRRRPGSSG